MKIYTLDFETDPFKFGRYPAPFVADIYDGDEHFTYWGPDCVQRALLFLYDKKAYCYAHNGGKFDFHFFLKYIEDGERVMIINGRVVSFKIGECEFRDSLNIIPVGLGKYKKDDIDYNLLEADVREQHREEIISYLHTDTESLYELVSSFIENYGLHLTQASAAMKYWRKLSKRKIPNSGVDYYQKFAPYYMGGRVECFKKGIIERASEAYDINSAYPFAMIHPHPWGLAYFEQENPSVSETLANLDSWKTGFFKIVARSRGALPFRNEMGALTFPNDDEYRVFYVTGHELKAAIETESIDLAETLNVIVHDEQITFDDYVYHFFNMRLEAKATGDKKTDIFCKIFLNALYGKFGSNPQNYKQYRVASPDTMNRLADYDYSFSGTMGGKILVSRPVEGEKQRFYNVATAASITGFVRAYLWRALHASVNPIYCDTDCIFAEKLKVETGKNLGQWGKEGDFDFAAVAGKKLYAFHKKGAPMENAPEHFKTASKGVRLSPFDLIRVAKGETVIYERDVPSYSYNNVPTFNTRKVRLT